MLASWDGQDNPLGVRYWLKGPVATQLIVEDKNPATLAYDFGWDCASRDAACAGGWSASTTSTTKSLHPIFVLTIYTGFPFVKIEAILENIWSTKLKDQSYSLDIRLGDPLASAAAYSNPP